MKRVYATLLVPLGLSAIAYTAYAQDPGQGVGVPGFGGAGRSRPGRPIPPRDPSYQEAIRRTWGMAQDGQARQLADDRGLDILNLTWEDTGRYKNSSVGPNISDMTIQVNDGRKAWCMPVIRYPNFSDKSADLDARDFTLLVGNEDGHNLQRVSLYDFLDEPTRYMSRPGSWRGPSQSLLASRDDKVLVSAQACFLPVPKQGKATFNPVLFNYQSSQGNPAVLTILATREGTSITTIDNGRDTFSEGSAWGQRLFHNEAGMRSSLTGERISDYNSNFGNVRRSPAGAGSNMVLLIQVPLKHREDDRFGLKMDSAKAAPLSGGFGGAAMKGRGGQSDVEAAVIGHGDLEGPYVENPGNRIERDPRYPIRVTVQFYKATSNGVVSEGDLRSIKRDIDQVYSQSDSVGSLVTEGETGRATEYAGCKVQLHSWWQQFWNRYQRDTGDSREEAMRRLRKLLGNGYEDRPVTDLYVRDLIRKRV